MIYIIHIHTTILQNIFKPKNIKLQHLQNKINTKKKRKKKNEKNIWKIKIN